MTWESLTWSKDFEVIWLYEHDQLCLRLFRPADSLKCIYGFALMYKMAMFFVKLSFLLQYLRIFPTKKTRIALWISLAVVVALGACNIITSIFICRPIQMFWESFADARYCFDIYQLWTVNASINLATDLLIIILPIPGIKRLMLPLRQRLGLMMVFAVGVWYVSHLRTAR